MCARKCSILLLIGLSVGLSVTAFAKKKIASARPPTTVTTLAPKQQLWDETLHAIGSLAAHQGITIHSEINGRLTQVFFNSGETVKAGDPLIQINPDIIKAKLALAKAERDLSELDYQRQKRLQEKKIETQALFDKITAERNAKQAIVDAQQALLNQTLIRAPFSGQLGLQQIEVGDFITAGQTKLVNLQNIDTLKVNFTLPEHALSSLKKGQTITVHSEMKPNKPTQGLVVAYDSLIESRTRTLAVRAEIPNPQHDLLPGAFVTVDLHIAQRKMLTVPQTALVYTPEGHFVFTVKQQKAVKTPVVTGPKIGQNIIIRQGLSPRDEVIATGQFKLSEGAPVQVQAATKATP